MSKYLFLLLIPTLFLVGCASASLEQRRAIEEITRERSKAREIPPSLPHQQTLQAGQWVSMIIEPDDGRNNLIFRTIKVVSVNCEPNGKNQVKIEVEDYEALKDAKWRREGYVINNFPAEPIFKKTERQFQEAINTLTFERVVRQDDGELLEDWPKELLVFSKEWMRKLFYFGHLYAGSKEVNCDNGYLRSTKCYRFGYHMRFMGARSTGRVYVHHAVPIVGFMEVRDTYRHVKVTGFGTDSQPELAF